MLPALPTTHRIQKTRKTLRTHNPHQTIDGDGLATEDGDCDDNDPNVYPTMTDECDGVDNNCDGTIDERCHRWNL